MVTQNSEWTAGHNVGQFSTILADPPWDVQQKGALGAAAHYKLMTLDAIKALPVDDVAAADAHCWLWVTNATLRAGYDVLEAWGFTPRSPLTWIKPPHRARPVPPQRDGAPHPRHARQRAGEVPSAADLDVRAVAGALAQTGRAVRRH
jgi:hypothetical protein